jgi:hypothetical protein
MPKQKLFILLIVLIIILASCHFPGQPWVLVEIISHQDGQQVALDQEVIFITQARSSQGIAKIELFVNGELQHEEEPPLPRPREHIAEQPWQPLELGPIIVSVIAIDRRGTISEPFNINLEVVPTVDDIDTEPTPTPTLSPEEIAQTQTAQALCTNSATFVEHVTIPINTVVSANANFTKIWRVTNNGTCDWVGYQVVHTSGNALGASSPRALPVVNAGSNADIVIDMVAPPSAGTYTGIWRIQAGDGNLFGPELTITIVVPERPTDTPVPTATFTLTPTATATRTPTPTVPPISVQQLTEQVNIPANATQDRTVTCPSGSIVTSGGFSHQSGIRVWHSTKEGNGWRIFATNTQGSARTLTVTATCLFNTGGSSTMNTGQQNIAANDFTRLTVTCPAGSLVTGGGWNIGTTTTALNVYQSNRLDNGWQIYVNNPTSDTPQVSVHVICMSGASGSTSQEVNPDNVVPANSTASAEKFCPAGRFVTGGGYVMDKELVLFNTSKEGNGWINYVANTTGSEKRLDTYAICYQP